MNTQLLIGLLVDFLSISLSLCPNRSCLISRLMSDRGRDLVFDRSFSFPLFFFFLEFDLYFGIIVVNGGAASLVADLILYPDTFHKPGFNLHVRFVIADLIEQEIFAALTETFHKPGFKLHVLVLQHLFCLV